ncbi:MAG: site-specific DNA methylase [Podoviridae sp. ctdb7]|nr:MAG: site-specific DNA methylase [Podoviridae sp. ctdb7]
MGYITYGSVCSGIEAATVAWEPLGLRAGWYAEIEPFPCAVLAHHYPDTPNHGDMTRLGALVLAGKIPAPDVLVGGTPCQAFAHSGHAEGRRFRCQRRWYRSWPTNGSGRRRRSSPHST